MVISIIMCCILICYILLNKNNTINTIHVEQSTYLKGIMAICVVLHHLSQKTETIFSIFNDFGAIAVGCFFFISGYGLFASYNKKGQAYLVGYPKKRFKKLLIPFLLVIVLYQIITKFKFLNILYENIVSGNVDPILPHSWYIFCAILFYFIFYIIFTITQNKVLGIIIIYGFTTLLFCSVLLIHWNEYWCKSLYLFPMGITYKYIENKILNKSSLWIVAILFIIFTTIISLYTLQFKHMGLCLANIAPYIFILPLTVIPISSKFLNYLGDISYEIYLVQGVVFYIFRNNLIYIKSDYIFIFVSLIGIITLAFIIKNILNKIEYFSYINKNNK